ncbi:MAG TPA: tetratricopeptide repeat protein [Myxococcota bacterium]|nr:tetratricopeptide repeat protein [Myxococcota bacterium]
MRPTFLAFASRLALATLLASSSVGCAKERAESIKLINEAINKEKLGNTEVAYALYARAVAIDPTNHRAHYQMALIDLYDKKQPDKARDRLLEAEKLVADDRDVLYQLGRYYLSLEQADKAPAQAGAPGAAGAQAEGSNLDKALGYLERALAADPNYAPAMYWKGYALMAKDNGPEADKALRAAIALDPKYAPAWRDLGELYERFDQTAAAAEVYKRGLEFSDDTSELLNALGSLDMAEGRPKDAIVRFEAAMQKAPDRNDFIFNLAMAFVAADDTKNAFRFLGEYINRADAAHAENVKVAHMLRARALERIEKEREEKAAP